MSIWWNQLQPAARRSFLAGLAVLVLGLFAAAWWLLRPAQAVLFSGLSSQDAAVFAAELDRMKTPYQVGDGGSSLLVDASQVHGLRLKLMGRDLPLHGAVGFELFNGGDVGLGEFAQKVNWQRALQGELTRTLLALPEVRAARVHLALPEQGLFRQAAQPAKAAVTIALQPGRALRPEQVAGIQRLLAAAVPGLAVHDVTVLDDQGVALSRPARLEGDGAANALLDLKRETEAYLARKAARVLDQALGAGRALASVDVTLAADQVRTTTEDVLPATGGRTPGAVGVLVRERESARDAPADARAEGRPAGGATQRDAEYQAGRRVEHVVSQPGAIRRLQLVAVVQEDLDPARQEQIKRLLGAAVGAVAERGDTVWVQPAPRAGTPAAGSAAWPAATEGALVPAARRPGPAVPAWTDRLGTPWLLALDAVIAAALCVALVLLIRQRRVQPQARLTFAQRQQALGQVQAWLAAQEALTVTPSGSTGEPR